MERKAHLKVAIVSPGDVPSERESLVQVFEDLNRNIASDKGFYLELVRWEDAYPRFHAQGAQGAIDESIRIPNCDIIVGMFWARFGSPVFDASSGTEHELRIAYECWKDKQKPHIMLYFKSQPFFPKTSEDADQLGRVFKFKESCPPEAFYGEYLDVEEFKRKVFNNLAQLLRDLAPGDPHLGEAVKQPPTPWLSSDKAHSRNWASLKLENIPLYTFSGLNAEPRNEDVVQDFRVDRQRQENPNPVSYLWADVYRGNSITASVEETDPPHLSVTFENKPTSWAGNLAIRPIGQQAVTRRSRPILAFETRLSTDSSSGASMLPEIVVSVRVVNGWCQHWAHGSAGQYFLFPVLETWNPIEVRLTSDKWWLFATDGNHIFGPQEPDFSILSSLVLVFGGPGNDEPGPGRGTVLVRNVHLKG